jgi:hypothetical protein
MYRKPVFATSQNSEISPENKRGGSPPRGGASPPFQSAYFALYSTTSVVIVIEAFFMTIFAVNPGMSWFV